MTCSVEEGLKAGTVEGEEAESLRAIHDAETAKLWDAIAPAIEAISAPFKDIGTKAAASLARSLALPTNQFAGIGKLDEQLAGLGRADEALRKSLSGLVTPPVVSAALPVEPLLAFPSVPPLDTAVIHQGSTLEEIRTGISELVGVVEAEHLLMAEQLRQAEEGAQEERRRYQVNIRLALIGLVASNAISVIIALLK
jgi:hypothetical protein